jgi:hypothetical protein
LGVWKVTEMELAMNISLTVFTFIDIGNRIYGSDGSFNKQETSTKFMLYGADVPLIGLRRWEMP